MDLTLPRFSADSRADLKDALSAMGMKNLFDPVAADLSGISGNQPPALFIGKVIHQANIDVVEQGTTASAATVVGGVTTGGGEPPKVTFHVDRPFLYFIRETRSGAILFMGHVSNPAAV